MHWKKYLPISLILPPPPSYYTTILFHLQKRGLCFKFVFVFETFFLQECLYLYLLLSSISWKIKRKWIESVSSFSFWINISHWISYLIQTVLPSAYFSPVWNCQRKDINMKGSECQRKIIRIVIWIPYLFCWNV